MIFFINFKKIFYAINIIRRNATLVSQNVSEETQPLPGNNEPTPPQGPSNLDLLPTLWDGTPLWLVKKPPKDKTSVPTPVPLPGCTGSDKNLTLGPPCSHWFSSFISLSIIKISQLNDLFFIIKEMITSKRMDVTIKNFNNHKSE